MKLSPRILSAFAVALAVFIMGLSSADAAPQGNNDPCAGKFGPELMDCQRQNQALQKMNKNVTNTNTAANQDKHKKFSDMMKKIK